MLFLIIFLCFNDLNVNLHITIIRLLMRKLANTFDAIIIGAGHNGLVAANYLAKANKKVLILEQRHLVGGAALT
jgi:ribulose 1,5-bisphosphate synthetase/thiazole synthase